MANWQRGNVIRAVSAVAAAWLVLIAGCHSASPVAPPTVTELPDARPDDFVLAATVYSPKSMREAKLPRSLRAARYIVEADGVLRAATGPGGEATTYPGQTRRLSAREFDSLWRMVRESGLLDAASAWKVEDPEGITRATDRTTALVYVGYEGKRTTLRLLLDRSGPEAVAAERVVDRLAEWAGER